ncbi:hypothetical protein K2X85_08400 [bacterium]|nr:hypothetical protein [bacterium]
MEQRVVAASVVGFIRHLALYHVNRGYEFYLTGRVPERKRWQPEEVDRAIVEKYGIAMSKYTRHRRRRAGEAAVAYYRHGEFWVMVATEGAHRFFDENKESIKSFRRQPLVFGGYSIGIKNDKLHVQLADDLFRELRGYLVNQAVHRSAARLAKEIYELPVEPFGPVQRQLRKILREVNAERKTAGMVRVPGRAIPCRLRVVRLTDRDADEGASVSVAILLQASFRERPFP